MKKKAPVAREATALRSALARFRKRGESIALVPTMGALHAGHLALVRRAQSLADRVVVSIFVNPKQFAPHEDLSTYPRPFAADLAALTEARVDLVWAPRAQVMYPADFSTRIVPAGPACVGLEDKFRPHFFDGVATVVTKLLIQCSPDIALFGQKDYQQLKVITRFARDLDLRIKIAGVPIVREKDGLALSSRNVYLSTQERTVAPLLHRTLVNCARHIADGDAIGRTMADGRRQIEKAGFALDYLEARDADTLEPVHPHDNARIRLLVAAKLGRTRLIDNVAVPARA